MRLFTRDSGDGSGVSVPSVPGAEEESPLRPAGTSSGGLSNARAQC